MLQHRYHNSIRARMTLTFAGAIAVLMTVVCSGAFCFARRTAEGEADALLRSVAEQVRGDMAQYGRRRPPAELIEEEREDLQPANLSLIIVDRQGRVIMQTRRYAPDWPTPHDSDWRVVSVPYGEDRAILGLPWRKTESALHAQAVGLSGLGLFVVLVSAAGAWWLVGRTLSPIGLLSRQARAASADDLSAHLDTPSRDAEMVELVETLNDLLARQAEAGRARGRFHAAASHELRTPLQALAGHLDLALQRPRSAEEYHAVVQEAQRQTRRLTALTRDLLLLNRLRSSPPDAHERIDLGDVCEAALIACDAMARARGLQVETNLPVGVCVQAAPTHTEMLARNLIENAIKYAQAEGEVRIRAGQSQMGAWLEIFNACPPLPDWNPEKLCEPFYRPDISRNSQTGGTGLGLAICKAICDVNCWRLQLEQVEHGVVSRVTFPNVMPT
jgi:signal transduction histidine kinase